MRQRRHLSARRVLYNTWRSRPVLLSAPSSVSLASACERHIGDRQRRHGRSSGRSAPHNSGWGGGGERTTTGFLRGQSASSVRVLHWGAKAAQQPGAASATRGRQYSYRAQVRRGGLARGGGAGRLGARPRAQQRCSRRASGHRRPLIAHWGRGGVPCGSAPRNTERVLGCGVCVSRGSAGHACREGRQYSTGSSGLLIQPRQQEGDLQQAPGGHQWQFVRAGLHRGRFCIAAGARPLRAAVRRLELLPREQRAPSRSRRRHRFCSLARHSARVRRRGVPRLRLPDPVWPIDDRLCRTTVVATRSSDPSRTIVPSLDGRYHDAPQDIAKFEAPPIGFGSRLNTMLTAAAYALKRGQGFQLSAGVCPIEHRDQPFCFFQPSSQCRGEDVRLVQAAEQDYHASLYPWRAHSRSQLFELHADICAKLAIPCGAQFGDGAAMLPMWRAVARLVYRVQPDVMGAIKGGGGAARVGAQRQLRGDARAPRRQGGRAPSRRDRSACESSGAARGLKATRLRAADATVRGV